MPPHFRLHAEIPQRNVGPQPATHAQVFDLLKYHSHSHCQRLPSKHCAHNVVGEVQVKWQLSMAIHQTKAAEHLLQPSSQQSKHCSTRVHAMPDLYSKVQPNTHSRTAPFARQSAVAQHRQGSRRHARCQTPATENTCKHASASPAGARSASRHSSKRRLWAEFVVARAQHPEATPIGKQAGNLPQQLRIRLLLIDEAAVNLLLLPKRRGN